MEKKNRVDPIFPKNKPPLNLSKVARSQLLRYPLEICSLQKNLFKVPRGVRYLFTRFLVPQSLSDEEGAAGHKSRDNSQNQIEPP